MPHSEFVICSTIELNMEFTCDVVEGQDVGNDLYSALTSLANTYVLGITQEKLANMLEIRCVSPATEQSNFLLDEEVLDLLSTSDQK